VAQITINNLKVLDDIKEQVKDATNDQLEEHFTEMANFAINESPIWSGSYVKSFSFKSDNTGSRGRRVDGARWRFPVKTGTEADRAEGRDLLVGDIKSVFANNDPAETKTYTLRNDANHAGFVERGVAGGAHPPGPKPPNGYQIFAQLRNLYG
jgi:hypothetical protein